MKIMEIIFFFQKYDRFCKLLSHVINGILQFYHFKKLIKVKSKICFSHFRCCWQCIRSLHVCTININLSSIFFSCLRYSKCLIMIAFYIRDACIKIILPYYLAYKWGSCQLVLLKLWSNSACRFTITATKKKLQFFKMHQESG